MSILALDIGGTFIKWASAEGYQLCEKGKVPTPRKSLEDFTACIDELFHAGKYDGIFWGIATAVYLAWSFYNMRWEVTWIVWPVAGVLYAVYHEIIVSIVKSSR